MKGFFTHTLPSGIRCILYQIDSPVAYCAVTINAGSRDELKKELGIAHFAEHSIFKGTARRKAHHINSRLDNLGGELNAFTTKEETVVHTTTLVDDIEKATELLSDIVFNSTFPKKEIEKEREVILDEINSYKDIPSERIFDEFEDLLFRGSALGHNILGTRASVKGFDSEDIIKFTGRCYNTDQMVFSIAGSISERKFIKIIERYLGEVKSNSREFKREVSDLSAAFNKSISRNTYQAHCIVGSRAYNNYEPDRAALSLLTNLLGGFAANSLLNVLLREKHGLTYAIDASYSPYSDTGVASIYFGTDRENVEQCLELIEWQLNKLKNNSMTDRQLAMAKRQLIGQLSISMDNKESYMLNVGKSYLIYNEVDSPEVINRKINAITVNDIMKVANEVFSNNSVLIYK